MVYKGLGKNIEIVLHEATVDVGKFTKQYGLATATIEGPWKKVGDKPIINLKHLGENAQSEDAYIWIEDNTYKMIMRDMGYWNHEYGYILNQPMVLNESTIGCFLSIS